MATQLPEQQRVAAIAEANRRAIANGTSVTAELSKYADSVGLSKSDAEVMMGYPVGTLGGTPAAAPAAKAPNQWDTVLNTIRTAAAGATPNLGIGSNMQVSGAGNQAAVNTPMPAAAAGGGGGAVSAGDNRWSGDPTRQPNGSFNPQPSGNLGMGGNGDMGYQRNPYLDATSRDIGAQMFDQWNRNVAPGLRSGAMATGGYGGSRQGVVEANALNDLGRNYSQALTGMYGTDYTNYQNRGIQRQGQQQSYNLGLGSLANQRYGQDQSYDLGLRNNDLGFANLDSNIYQNNFNNQLQSANFGLGVQDYLNKNNQAGITAGTNIQNTGLDYQKYYNDAIKGYGNAGGTRNGTTTT